VPRPIGRSPEKPRNESCVMSSMEFHMDVAGPLFRTYTDFINLSTIEVYGQGSGTVVVHQLYAGFARFGPW
jgi:hypothetical protein